MSDNMSLSPVARERRHTLFFLDEIRPWAPVFLDTDVDMARVRAHRAAAGGRGRPYSTVAYVLYTAARVLAAHPAANAAIRGRSRPRVAHYHSVHGKVTLDKTLNGKRVVLAAVLRNLHQADLDEIQRRLQRYRDGDPNTMPEFAPTRMLHKLPWPVGRMAYSLGVRPLGRRSGAMGTFAVTSLGHRSVDTFFSVGGATITLGLGRIAERPMARDGQVVIAPTMRLSLTFDHRVIDGAEAADILAEIKEGLESFQHVADITSSRQQRILANWLGSGEAGQSPRAAGSPLADRAAGSPPPAANDLGELKEHVIVHARGQRIADYRELLDRIHCDEGSMPGSWVAEWCGAAELLEDQGNDLAASRYYAMARFPYVDGPARQDAQERCRRAFDRWRRDRGIEPLDAEIDGGLVRCWTAGLSATERKPLLVVMGGIVTIKEQWAPMLGAMRRLGMAALVTEMPGVGENSLRYEPDSWRMLSGLLDAVADRAQVDQTYAMALSFSGHMAMRCATEDPRIKGVITVGAPVSEFFTNRGWQRQVPQITLGTLAHMTGTSQAGLSGCLEAWALTRQQLSSLEIPVCYAASRRDGIIPHGDVRLLRDCVPNLSLVEYDDVHGAPGHVAQTQLWSVASLLRLRGVRNMQSGLVGLLLRGQQMRDLRMRPRA
jgi:hypothetical protein